MSGTERVLFSGDHIAGFAVTRKGLYIADAGKLSVSSITANGELTATIALANRSPEMLETLTLDSLFLLNLPHDHQPAIVLPYDSPVVLFIPDTESGDTMTLRSSRLPCCCLALHVFGASRSE